jgi:hypothetical protein
VLLSRIQARRQELIQRGPAGRITREDCDRFNALLEVARRERPRDPLVRSIPPIAPDQDLSRAATVDLYDRLALAFGEGGTSSPISPRGGGKGGRD